MALPFGLKTGQTAKTIVTTAVDPADLSKGNKQVEFSARCLAHAIVYQKNGKPIKTAEVPEMVKEQLIGTMLAGMSAGQVEMDEKPEAPTEVVDEVAEVAKELIEKIKIPENVQVESTPVAPNPMYEPSVLESNSIEDEFGFVNEPTPEIDYESLLQEVEARSVDNVNLKELVDALYRRFRIYLPYINQPPKGTDISPTTGMAMNAITFVQAVQGFKTAQRTGASWNPRVIASQIQSARSAAGTEEMDMATPEEQAQAVTPFKGREVHMPNLHGEPEPPIRVNRSYDSPHQSAVAAHRGKEGDGLDPDEVYAEPPINASTSIIRPFYPNKQTQQRLKAIEQQGAASVPHNINFEDIV